MIKVQTDIKAPVTELSQTPLKLASYGKRPHDFALCSVAGRNEGQEAWVYFYAAIYCLDTNRIYIQVRHTDIEAI